MDLYETTYSANKPYGRKWARCVKNFENYGFEIKAIFVKNTSASG
jgi:hypothetical protein